MGTAEEKKAALPEPPSRRVRRPSDASETVSESSWCSSVSTAATLALSLDEERQAQKMEKKLRDIARLEERQAQGEVLDKLQVAKIEGKAEIESSVGNAESACQRRPSLSFVEGRREAHMSPDLGRTVGPSWIVQKL